MTNSNAINSILIECYKKSSISCCKVIGNSMFPLLRKGDWIYVEPIDVKKLKIGDIILFHIQQRFVVHRIVKISNEYLVTKGDWSRFLDAPIFMDNVIGKVTAIRRGKHKLSFSHPILLAHNFFVNTINQTLINFVKE